MTSKVRPLKTYVKDRAPFAFKLCAPKKAPPLHPEAVRSILLLAELDKPLVDDFIDSALGQKTKMPVVSVSKDGRRWTYEACDGRIKLLLDTRLGKFGYELGEDSLGKFGHDLNGGSL